MTSLLGGGAKAAQPVAANGINLQQSANGLPIPIVYGQVKLAPNLIWYGDFAAIKQSQQQGKGGSGSSYTYDYQVAAILALCEGPIHGVQAVWVDQAVKALSDLGMSLYTGAPNQPVWGYLASRHPGQALTYQSTAYVAVAPYDLGSSPNLPNHNFETQGAFWKTGAGSLYDADPSMMVLDFLTNEQYGLGFPLGNIDLVSLQTGPASYQKYCQATGLWLSAGLTDQEAARDTLTRWLQLTNSAAFWSGDLLKIVPYGDTTVTANGFTFTPDVTPIYDLDDDDFIHDDSVDPIQPTRSDVEDAKNWVKLEILDRDNQYATDPIEAKDQAQIDLYGPLPADQITAHEICDPTVGAIAAQLILQRSVYVRNTYQFTVGWEYCLLEPMDIVTLTDALLEMTKLPVRITSIEEDDQGNLTITAEEFPAGIATATEYPKQTRAGYIPNTAVAPGPVNPPVIFEPSSDLAMSAPQVWVAASGGANWGGCTVHLSIDGTRFDPIGQIRTPARLGVLTVPIGAVADPDTTTTLSVDLSESPGASLVSGTKADADASRTLIYVDGELMAYETATLTGLGQYALSYLRRGLFGTAVAEHPVGAEFARIDGTQFAYDLPPAYIGATLYLKFTSFNIYGVQEEEISTVAVYDFVPTGKGGYIAPPSQLLVSSTNRLAADGTAISTLIVVWTASPGPLLAGYELDYRIHTADGSNAWVAVQLGPDTTSWTLTPAVEGATYDIRVRAISGLTPPTYSTFALPTNNAAVAYDETIPAAPTGLQAVAVYPQVNVYWQVSGSASIANYELKAAQGAGATFAQAATIYKGPANQFTHAGFSAGDIWTYWVAAISRAGNEGPFSAPVLVNTPLGYDPTGILENSISASQLVHDLQEQIGGQGAAEAALADMVNQATEAMGTSGAIAQARQDLQTYTDNASQAQANATTALVSLVSSVSAALSIEEQTRASADAASASLILQLQAAVAGVNTASITNQITAIANSASTQAQEISTLQTSASNANAAIQTIANSLNGISAEYTIQTEVDVHGTRYIAGIGALANASGVSQVTILANDFLVAGMNADGSLNPVSPFEVVNGQVLMQKAVVGTITADQIAANTTYTGNLSIGNGQLLLHGADDGNGNGPYFITRDSNGTNRALVGRYGNEWGIWVWNAAGANVLSADGLGVSIVGTNNAAQYAFSGMSGASTAGAQTIPTTQTWVDVQTVAFTTVSGATGVAITYSAELLDLYADPNAPYGNSNDAGGGNGGGGGDN